MRRFTVLLVDDDIDALDGYAVALRGLGHRLRFAEGADEALARLAEEPVDVLVTDYRMPCGDGVTLMREVADEWPDVVRILVTGWLAPEEAAASREEGLAHRVLLKPFGRDALRAALREATDAIAADLARGLPLGPERHAQPHASHR